MNNPDHWTTEEHTNEDLGFAPDESDPNAWCLVAPVNDPDAEPVITYTGSKLPDGRMAFAFLDRDVAESAAAYENGDIEEEK